MDTLYVGIDVAKAKFDVAFTINGKETFNYSIFQNDAKGFSSFFKLTKQIKKEFKLKNIHFLMEATGNYHCELCEFLQNSAQVVSVVNPFQTKSFAKSLLQRTKNDKVDSSMLAQYAYTNKPSATPKTPENIKHLKALVRYENSLVKEEVREIAILKSSLDTSVKKLTKEQLRNTRKLIKKVENEIEEFVKNDEFLATQTKLLKTIPGVGMKIASNFLAILKFDKLEDISPKAQVANAGLSPREYSSGTSVRGRNHISRMGNKQIRKVLFMPALSCIRQNNHFSKFYNRLVENGKPKKVAIVAVMRKIILTASAVLKYQQPFDPNWAMKQEQKFKEALMAKIA